jgi:hypothetical protein
MPAVAKKYSKNLTDNPSVKTFCITLTVASTGDYNTAKTLGEAFSESYMLDDYSLRGLSIEVEEITGK